jgi:hypothetical protein
MDSDVNSQAPGDAGARSIWRERLRDSRNLVPTLAVVVVVVTALAATVAVTHPDWQEASRPPAMSKADLDVVRAPPLVVKAPPMKESPKSAGQAKRQAPAAPLASNALGAGPACSNCGVVESVAMVNQHGSFQMRIRMDDGTVRTVEQRGALAAGSRVLLEGGTVRIMPAGTRQG